MLTLFLSLFLSSVLIIPEGSSTPVNVSSPAASEESQSEEAAPEGIGTVAQIQGKVEAVSGNGRRQLNEGDAVYLNDTIMTETGASVQIEFTDESLFTVSEKTSIRLDEFVYEENSKDVEQAVTITKGIFRFISGKIAKAKPENVNLEVPSGTIGIRGTIVVGEIEGERCLVSLEAEEGDKAQHRIVVMNKIEGKMQQVEITRPGFATVIERRGEMPKPAFQLPEQNRNRFQQNLPQPKFLPRGPDGRPQQHPHVRAPGLPLRSEAMQKESFREGLKQPGPNQVRSNQGTNQTQPKDMQYQDRTNPEFKRKQDSFRPNSLGPKPMIQKSQGEPRRQEPGIFQPRPQPQPSAPQKQPAEQKNNGPQENRRAGNAGGPRPQPPSKR